MPPKRPASPSEGVASPSKVYISESIHDRKSVFVGYYGPQHSKVKDLQSREDVKSASHRIVAWRNPSNQRTLLPSSRTLFQTGHDDDGEQWAGKKVENLMEQMDIRGVIMVARWYGGELLGPVRFKHIEDVAKGAVDAWRSEKEDGLPKRQKVETQTEESANTANTSQTMRPDELQRRKKDIIHTLQRRDESIATLRVLLEQKKSEAAPKLSQPAANASPSRSLNYDSLPFNRLQALENARDMTISFLLKEIDKAEAEAIKQEEDAQKRAQSAAALKAEEEELELDEAWAEMENAMNTGQTSR